MSEHIQPGRETIHHGTPPSDLGGAGGPDVAHHGPNVRAYFGVFGALVLCTLVSFVANVAERQGVMSVFASFVIIFAVACLKATLVAVVFMHLMFDWKKVYILIVPALILGPMFMIVLLPDIVLAWKTANP
jgi:caa(3)-type oxidase subunit IV